MTCFLQTVARLYCNVWPSLTLGVRNVLGTGWSQSDFFKLWPSCNTIFDPVYLLGIRNVLRTGWSDCYLRNVTWLCIITFISSYPESTQYGLYIAIFCSRANSLRSCRMRFWKCGCNLFSGLFYFSYQILFSIHRSGVLTALFGCYMAGATWNCCRLGARSLYTI